MSVQVRGSDAFVISVLFHIPKVSVFSYADSETCHLSQGWRESAEY